MCSFLGKTFASCFPREHVQTVSETQVDIQSPRTGPCWIREPKSVPGPLGPLEGAVGPLSGPLMAESGRGRVKEPRSCLALGIKEIVDPSASGLAPEGPITVFSH